jgi:hypothetical protein
MKKGIGCRQFDRMDPLSRLAEVKHGLLQNFKEIENGKH